MSKKKKSFSAFRNTDDPKMWFDTQDAEGSREEVKLCVKMPNKHASDMADIVHSAKAREFYEAGCLLRSDIKKSQAHKDKLEELDAALNRERVKLTKGGMSKRAGYDLAVKILKMLEDINEVNAEYSVIDRETMEAKADDARFQVLIAECLFYDDGPLEGKKYFESYESMLESEDTIVQFAGMHLLLLMVNLTEMKKRTPEYKFLHKYGFCDDELKLKNFEKTHYCTLDGKLIDKDGFYISETGQRVDKFGNPVKADGSYDMPEAEFFDE